MESAGEGAKDEGEKSTNVEQQGKVLASRAPRAARKRKSGGDNNSSISRSDALFPHFKSDFDNVFFNIFMRPLERNKIRADKTLFGEERALSKQVKLVSQVCENMDSIMKGFESQRLLLQNLDRITIPGPIDGLPETTIQEFTLHLRRLLAEENMSVLMEAKQKAFDWLEKNRKAWELLDAQIRLALRPRMDCVSTTHLPQGEGSV